MVSDKPIIYIYPEQEQNVKVTLGSSDKLLVSYPVYNNGWNVLAKPDGTLIDNKTNRELYSLYYEAERVRQIEARSLRKIRNSRIKSKRTRRIHYLLVTNTSKK